MKSLVVDRIIRLKIQYHKQSQKKTFQFTISTRTTQREYSDAYSALNSTLSFCLRIDHFKFFDLD